MPNDLIIAINEYAYYNGSIKPGPMIEIIFDAPGIMKRMFTGAVERWTEDSHPRYIATVDRWQGDAWRRRSAA